LTTHALKRLFTEPLLHFIIIGGLLFLLYVVNNEPDTRSSDTIVITSQRISQIESGFNSVWKRSPDSKELKNLIEQEVRSEVYYRDALALGLDKNDAIVRRRLRQKMEFLTDTGTYRQEPSENELKAFHKDHITRYQINPQLAFEHVYLGANPSPTAIKSLLDKLQADPAQDLTDLGERSRLPAQMRLSRPMAIDNVFGGQVFEQLAALPPGIWSGPVLSNYGSHLARTLDSVSSSTPLFETIRDQLIKDWKEVNTLEAREQDYDQRLARYTIDIQPHAGADAQKP
jgi:hypothetical protein